MGPLDQAAFASLAAGAGIGEYFPSSVPMAATIGIWYFADDGVGLGYRVLESETSNPPFTPPLEAYAWVLPNPVFDEVDGRRSVTFPSSGWFADRDQTAIIIIIQIDDATQVMWSSNGTPPMPTDELAAIPLTPAAPDDPRWLEIAYESGNYDAQG